MIFSSHTVIAAARFEPKGSIFSSMIINIATPGWDEYEEEVNCSPQNEADPKGEEEIQRGVC